MSQYNIVYDFQARNKRVLVLDRNLGLEGDKLMIDGIEYTYLCGSTEKCIIIDSTQSFTGKQVVFE